jgi:high-affinity iron transporter
MLFWMKMQSAGISRELKDKIDVALSSGSVLALSLLAFSAVGREGLETSLFLFAGSSNQDSQFAFLLGGILGFVVAAGAGVILYYGAARLPMKQFFMVSGVILIVLAAGLLSNALTALNEAAVLADLGPRPWDTEATIAMTSSLGKFSHTLLGYDSAPALSQIIVYWTYLIVVLTLYLFAPVPGQNRDRTRPAAVPAATHSD